MSKESKVFNKMPPNIWGYTSNIFFYQFTKKEKFMIIKNARTLLSDESLVENKPYGAIIPNKYSVYCIDETHRSLSLDEISMYRNLCESYSDMRAYFLCKTFFSKNEVTHLKGQLEYFNYIKNYFYSPNSMWDAPNYLKREIASMEGHLVRYFAQFNEEVTKEC